MISESFGNSSNIELIDITDKEEEKLISRRVRGKQHSMDLNSELNDISRIQPKSKNQIHLIGIPNNNIMYFNSLNNESLTTNLENSSNFNDTEIENNINNNKLIINVNNKNLDNIFNDNSNKNANSNYPIDFNNMNADINLNKISSDKKLSKLNNFNKSKKINNSLAKEIKMENVNVDSSKISINMPKSVDSGSVNSNFINNHYENFKNNKKEPKAFKIIAPMLINSIPRYDL
jgi:hypothetical protein